MLSPQKSVVIRKLVPSETIGLFSMLFVLTVFIFFLMSPNVYYLALLDWKVSVFMCIMNYTDRSSPRGDLLGRL